VRYIVRALLKFTVTAFQKRDSLGSSEAPCSGLGELAFQGHGRAFEEEKRTLGKHRVQVWVKWVFNVMGEPCRKRRDLWGNTLKERKKEIYSVSTKSTRDFEKLCIMRHFVYR
jgi:hypothetical protein